MTAQERDRIIMAELRRLTTWANQMSVQNVPTKADIARVERYIKGEK